MGSFLSLGNTALARMVTDLSGASSFFILIGFVFLLHSQIRMEYRCSCANKTANLWYCWTIMILPAVLVLFLVLAINKRFQRSLDFTSRYCCRANSRSKCHFLSALTALLNRACFAALVWVVVLLIDGDWYLCCSYSLPKEQSHLPCKDKSKLSDEDKDVIFQMKNTSTGIGLMILTSIICLVFILSAVTHRCRYVCPTICGQMDSYRNKFKDSLLEETHQQIKSSLKTAADKYVTAKLFKDPKMKALQWTPGDHKEVGNTSTGDAAIMAAEKVETLDEVIAQVRSVEWAAISDFTFEIIDDLPGDVVDNGETRSQYRRFISVDITPADVSGQEE